MKLNELRPAPGSKKSKKRVGRGESSGLGKTAGRGSQGQRSRKGHSMNPAFEGGQTPYFRRIPKKGFSNHPFKEIYSIINLSDLNGRFVSGDTINQETLIASGLIRRKNDKIKLLGNGALELENLKVSVDKVSATAKAVILEKKGEVCDI